MSRRLEREAAQGHQWEWVFDTAQPEETVLLRVAGGVEYPLQGRSLSVFRVVTVEEALPVVTVAAPGVVATAGPPRTVAHRVAVERDPLTIEP